MQKFLGENYIKKHQPYLIKESEKIMQIKHKIILGLVLLLAITGLLYRFFIYEKIPEDLIAIVGDQKIYLADFNSEIKRRGGRQLDKLDKNKLLDEMILRKAMIDQAIKKGVDKQPDFIRTYQNLLIGQYKKKFLKPKIDGVDLTSDEIQRYYTENIQKYTQPEKARLAMIFMKTHSKMSDAKKDQIMKRMLEAKSKAKQPVKGRGFGRIAVQYSEDQTSRYKGGDIGWVYKNRNYRWEDSVLKAGFALKELNDVSDIITTDKGLYIVKLLDRRSSKVTPFKKVKDRIRHKQILETRKSIEKTFEEDVRQKTPVKIYSDALEKVKMPKTPKKNQLPVPTP